MALSPFLDNSGLGIPDPVQLAASGQISADQAADMVSAAEDSARQFESDSNFHYSKDNIFSKTLRDLGIASVDYQNEFNVWSADRANRFAADQAARANEFSKSERLASQEFNAEQARLQRDFESASAREAMEFNASEAEKARRWQQEIRQTAYQDTLKDMKAAGLNPLLAYSQGATAASGSATASAAGVPSGSSAYSTSHSGHGASSRSAVSATVRSLVQAFGDLASSAVLLHRLSLR